MRRYADASACPHPMSSRYGAACQACGAYIVTPNDKFLVGDRARLKASGRLFLIKTMNGPCSPTYPIHGIDEDGFRVNCSEVEIEALPMPCAHSWHTITDEWSNGYRQFRKCGDCGREETIAEGDKPNAST